MLETSRVDVVGVGLNATDTVISVGRYPERGSKTEYTEDSVQPGGSVATAVIACQIWGLSTRYVGKLGGDDAGNLHMREFARTGVDARVIREPGVASARSVILVDGLGERTVLARRDGQMVLLPPELQREWITNARLLHLDGHDMDAALCAARWAKEAGIPIVADLDAIYPGIEDLLALIDYPVLSRDFPTRLTGVTDMGIALQTIYRRFLPKLLDATLGAEGVLAFDGKRLTHRSAFIVPAVDTTGAGDIFHAGFIYGLVQKWPLEQMLDFACAAAGLNCTALGARGGIETLARIEQFLQSGKRHTA